MFPSVLHAAGGRLLVPVSSNATCVPVAVKMRKVVEPMQRAPVYRDAHMLTTNVCPAEAVTPHTGVFVKSVFVWLVVYSWQSKRDVDATVFPAVGAAVGVAEGLAVGMLVGAGVGRAAPLKEDRHAKRRSQSHWGGPDMGISRAGGGCFQSITRT